MHFYFSKLATSQPLSLLGTATAAAAGALQEGEERGGVDDDDAGIGG